MLNMPPNTLTRLTKEYLARRGLSYGMTLDWGNEVRARFCLIKMAWAANPPEDGVVRDYSKRLAIYAAGIKEAGVIWSEHATNVRDVTPSDLCVQLYQELGSVHAVALAMRERGYLWGPKKVREAVFAQHEREDRLTYTMLRDWTILGPSGAAVRYGCREEELNARVNRLISTEEVVSVARAFLDGTSLQEICVSYFIDTDTAKEYCCRALWVFRTELDLNEPAWGEELKPEAIDTTVVVIDGVGHEEMLNAALELLKTETTERKRRGLHDLYRPLRWAIRKALTPPGMALREKPVGEGRRGKAFRDEASARAAERRQQLAEARAAEPIKERRARRERERRARIAALKEAGKLPPERPGDEEIRQAKLARKRERQRARKAAQRAEQAQAKGAAKPDGAEPE